MVIRGDCLIFIFDSNESLLLVLDNNVEDCLPFYDAIHTDKLNESNTFEFKVPIDHPDSENITEGNFVAFKDKEGDFIMFEVKIVEEDHTDYLLKYAYCENVSNELLDEFIISQSFTAQSVTTIMSTLLSDTRWTLGTTDITGTYSIDIVRESVLSSIFELIKVTNAELKFYIEFTGNIISSRKVDFLIRRGTDTSLRFEYGRNLTEIKKTNDFSNIKTALYGYGKAIEDDTEGKSRVSFKDVVWTSPTNPADKPSGQEYIEDSTAKALYGYAGGTRNRYGKVDFDSIDDSDDLLEATWNKLQEINIPKITYECKISDLDYLLNLGGGTLQLGDSLIVIDNEFNPELIVQVRVIEIVRYLNEEDKEVIVLGNFLNVITDQGDQINSIERTLTEADFSVPTSILNGIIDVYNNEIVSTNGYVYITDSDGIVIYDQPTKALATQALRLKGGIWGISNTKDGFGEFIYTTAADGNGIVATTITTGELNANLVVIRGDTYFYWDGNYLMVQDPSNSSQQIRIGKYDGTNYGIGFTRDSGSTFNTIMDWDGVLVEDAEFRLLDESGIENILRPDGNMVKNSGFEVTDFDPLSGDTYSTYLVTSLNAWDGLSTNRIYRGMPSAKFGDNAGVVSSTSWWYQIIEFDSSKLQYTLSGYATSYDENTVSGTARVRVQLLNNTTVIAYPPDLVFTITSGVDFNWIREKITVDITTLTYTSGFDYTDVNYLEFYVEIVTSGLSCLVDGFQINYLDRPTIYTENLELYGFMTGYAGALSIKNFGVYTCLKPLSTENLIFDFEQDYALYSDNAGVGSDNSRLWLSAPDGGQIIIGGRTATHFLDRISIKAREVHLLVDATSGVYGIWDDSFTGGSGTEPVLHPTVDLFGQIGTTSLRWYRGYAGAWLTTSSIEVKEDIEKEDIEDAYNIIKDTPIHRYRLKKDKDSFGDKACYYVGAIAEECSKDITDEKGKNINLYSMISIVMSGSQKIIADKEKLETKVEELENTISLLIDRIEKLENSN